MGCELKWLAKKEGWPECSGRLHRHHIVARSKTVKSKALRKATERPELYAWVCALHNVGRWADSKVAQELFFANRRQRYPDFESILDSLPYKRLG